MSTSWYRGGDLSPDNQVRNPLKARYFTRAEEYTSAYGSVESPQVNSGTAEANWMRQVRRSYGHPYRLLGRADHDIGGEFLSLKTEVLGGRHFGSDRLYGGNPDSVVQWSGWAFASSEAAQLCSAPRRTPAQELAYLTSKVPSASTVSMHSHGTTAINRCAPTNPLVDLSTSMAELLREGLPSIPGRNASNPGGEYLNYQFGIAPLVSDVRDLRKVLADADALWAQYERNSGKHIRRAYEFPPKSETTTTTGTGTPQVVSVKREDGSFSTVAPSGSLVQPGTVSSHIQTDTRFWFNGAFTYFLPKSGWRREMERLDRLYGLSPGVDTIYQLTPWSWLVDYFFNLGDVIENLNAFTKDGLVMPYGYVMAETTTTTLTTLNFGLWNGTVFTPQRVSDTVTKTSKRRLPATPFGFGLTDSGLTPKQWSILAALGLSRR